MGESGQSRGVRVLTEQGQAAGLGCAPLHWAVREGQCTMLPALIFLFFFQGIVSNFANAEGVM